MDDARADILRQREKEAIAQVGREYSREIATYLANPDRDGKKCLQKVVAEASFWSGISSSGLAACNALIKREIITIRNAETDAIALAKTERAERRKSMSEVAAKLDEMDERQEDRDRALAKREAAMDADARERAHTDAVDADLAKAKRFSCSMGNRKDC